MNLNLLPEKEFRAKVQETFKHIEKACESIDPDVLEMEWGQGSFTLNFEGRSKCILSTQPSIGQLWLALASRGIAYHFNYDSTRNQWWDDKTKSIELFSFLKRTIQEEVKIEVSLAASF